MNRSQRGGKFNWPFFFFSPLSILLISILFFPFCRTINYRLGVLGFCNGIEGIPPNLGLHDQRMAIQWLKDNAEIFGGDSDNITLMGESAGAASVHFHAVSRKNQERTSNSKLFHKIILQVRIGANGIIYNLL